MRTAEDRFWEKIQVHPLGCWVWQGTRMNTGYGEVRVDNRKWLAHRFAHELAIGPIPQGLTVDHLCFNKLCVNPAHLEAVTQSENAKRAWQAGRWDDESQKRRAKTHCKHGHEFTAENTFRSKRGMRQCKACAVRNQRLSRARRKAQDHA